MMVQTSVIQIDRSTGCHAVIGNAHLGMTESWCPFIDSYAILYQVVIERSGNAVDQFLIRNSRRDDSYIYTTFCCQRQSMCHLIGNNQIRRHKPAVFFCFIHDADIHILADLNPIQRTIRIWLDIPFLHRLIRMLLQVFFAALQIKCIFFNLLFPGSLPHFQKCSSKRCNRISFQTDSGIFPLSVWMRIVKIFICQVITTRIANLSIDNCNLPVITVIQEHIKSRKQRIKYPARNSFCLQLSGKIQIDKSNRTHVIIEHTDFYASLYPILQNGLDPAPRILILDCMVFHKNKMFCLRKIHKLGFQPLNRLVKIFHVCILVNRISCDSFYICRNIASFWIFFF